SCGTAKVLVPVRQRQPISLVAPRRTKPLPAAATRRAAAMPAAPPPTTITSTLPERGTSGAGDGRGAPQVGCAMAAAPAATKDRRVKRIMSTEASRVANGWIIPHRQLNHYNATRRRVVMLEAA